MPLLPVNFVPVAVGKVVPWGDRVERLREKLHDECFQLFFDEFSVDYVGLRYGWFAIRWLSNGGSPDVGTSLECIPLQWVGRLLQLTILVEINFVERELFRDFRIKAPIPVRKTPGFRGLVDTVPKCMIFRRNFSNNFGKI